MYCRHSACTRRRSRKSSLVLPKNGLLDHSPMRPSLGAQSPRAGCRRQPRPRSRTRDREGAASLAAFLRRLQIGEFITVSCTQWSNRRFVRVACRPVRSNTFVMEIENKLPTRLSNYPPMREAKFAIGQVVKHRIYPFRGVIFDVDPVFANTEELLASISEEARPRRDQPFYHLLADTAQTTYVAYVSEQNLLAAGPGRPVSHPQVPHFFK